MLRDVAEVILVHPDGGGLIAAPPELRATVVNERGRSFDVDKLRYRGQRELAFQQGRRRRELDMGRIERIEFKEPGTEQRTIVISLRSGKTITATVDASTVRLSGERDQQYWSRVDSAFTGRAGAARFGIGLQDIRLIVLHEERADSTAAPTAEADTTSP